MCHQPTVRDKYIPFWLLSAKLILFSVNCSTKTETTERFMVFYGWLRNAEPENEEKKSHRNENKLIGTLAIFNVLEYHVAIF